MFKNMSTEQKQVCLDICSKFNLPIKEVLSDSRKKHLVRVRQVIMSYFVYTGLSYPKVGIMFNKDHTTIIHAKQKVDSDYELSNFLSEYVIEVNKVKIDKLHLVNKINKYKNLFNLKVRESEIMKELNIDYEDIYNIHKMALNIYGLKKVPDYKKNCVYEIFN